MGRWVQRSARCNRRKTKEDVRWAREGCNPSNAIVPNKRGRVFTMGRLVTLVLIVGIVFLAIAIIGPSKSGAGAYMEQNATIRSWDVSIRDAVRSSPAGDKLVAMGFLENGPKAPRQKRKPPSL